MSMFRVLGMYNFATTSEKKIPQYVFLGSKILIVIQEKRT